MFGLCCVPLCTLLSFIYMLILFSNIKKSRNLPNSLVKFKALSHGRNAPNCLTVSVELYFTFTTLSIFLHFMRTIIAPD